MKQRLKILQMLNIIWRNVLLGKGVKQDYLKAKEIV